MGGGADSAAKTAGGFIFKDEWGRTVTDPALRLRALATVAQTWVREDAAATWDWLDTSDALSPTDRAALREQLATGFAEVDFHP